MSRVTAAEFDVCWVVTAVMDDGRKKICSSILIIIILQTMINVLKPSMFALLIPLIQSLVSQSRLQSFNPDCGH